MAHVLVLGPIHPDGLAVLERAPGITMEVLDTGDAGVYAPRLPDADALVVRTQPITGEMIASAGRLAILSRHGVGYDSVDVAALDERRVPLAIVGDVNSKAVAEQAMMMMLALARRTLVYDARLRAGDWGFRNSLDAVELHGRELLVVGFGRIGRHVARMAAPFGLSVVAYDPFVSDEVLADHGVRRAPDLSAALETADVVTLHVPRAGEGYLIGAAELARMKPSAFLVNTARGGLVDEAALVAALAAGRLAGAGLDVFEAEPPAKDHPLFASDRVVLSPHSSTLTAECARRMAVASAQNVVDFFAGRLDPSLVVNARSIGWTADGEARR